MRKLSNEEKRGIYQKILVATICIAIYFLFLRMDKLGEYISYFITISRPIVLGLSLAFILNILLSTIEKFLKDKLKIRKEGLRRTISIVLTYIIFFAILVFMVVSVVPRFVDSMISLVGQLPNMIESVIDWLSGFKILESKMPIVRDYFSNMDIVSLGEKAIEFLFGDIANTVSGTLNVLQVILQSSMESFLMLIFSIYALASKENLQSNSRKLMYAVLPEKFADSINRVCKLLYVNFYSFFTGQLLEALILGILCFIGMTILGLPYSLMISVFVGFTNLIPYFGATIGAILSAILLFMNEPIQGIIVLVFIIILQQIDGNYIYPRLVGSRMGIPSIWVLFSITIGGALMGIVGMIVFVPLMATVYVLLKIYSNKKLQEKNIDIEEKTNMEMYDIEGYYDINLDNDYDIKKDVEQL